MARKKRVLEGKREIGVQEAESSTTPVEQVPVADGVVPSRTTRKRKTKKPAQPKRRVTKKPKPVKRTVPVRAVTKNPEKEIVIVEKRSWWKWIMGGCFILILALAVLVAALSYVGVKFSDRFLNALPDDTASIDAGPTNIVPAAKVNEEVPANDLVWKVTKATIVGTTLAAKDSRAPQGAKDVSAQNGQFVKIDLTVRNAGQDAVTPATFALLDNAAKEYPFCFSCELWLPEQNFQPLLTPLAAGDSFNFSLYYDVPKTARGLELRIGNLGLLDQEEAFVDLGLD